MFQEAKAWMAGGTAIVSMQKITLSGDCVPAWQKQLSSVWPCSIRMLFCLCHTQLMVLSGIKVYIAVTHQK